MDSAFLFVSKIVRSTGKLSSAATELTGSYFYNRWLCNGPLWLFIQLNWFMVLSLPPALSAASPAKYSL